VRSQNQNISQKILSEKDIFGTRTFIENKNQFNRSIKKEEKIFYALENGAEKIYFTGKGVIYKQVKKQRITHEMYEAIEHGEKVQLKPDENYFIEMNWINANPNINIKESEKQKHYLTYGDPEFNSRSYKKKIFQIDGLVLWWPPPLEEVGWRPVIN